MQPVKDELGLNVAIHIETAAKIASLLYPFAQYPALENGILCAIAQNVNVINEFFFAPAISFARSPVARIALHALALDVNVDIDFRLTQLQNS